MNIVTIMNYPPDPNYDKMCYIWLDRVIKHGGDNITIFYAKHKPFDGLKDFKNEANISIERRRVRRSLYRHRRRKTRRRTRKSLRRRYEHFNTRFKLPILASLNFEFIFLDADIYVIKNLNYLWDRRKDKAFIGINHQKLLRHRETIRNKPFLNSGVQIVSDPKFYNYNEIINSHIKHGWKWESWGTDQALLNDYFNTIGYDYTHPEIGTEWNACAGANRLKLVRGVWRGRTNKRALGKPHPVYINHYWSPRYKPWVINCPLHTSYTNI